MSEESFRTTHLQRCLQRIRNGDAAARDELIRDCQGRLKRLAHLMLRDYPRVGRNEQTDDVFQEAALRLVHVLEGVPVPPGSVREFFSLAAWKIRQVLLDMARRYRARPAAGADAPVRDKPDVTHEPAGLAEWCELHDKIDQLPPEEKEVFDLLFYQGVKQEEAARLLGVDTRTVQRRWLAAKLSLHDLVGGQFPSL
jgi:RNA polymerase sigma-70 factor (ECF subfamily)